MTFASPRLAPPSWVRRLTKAKKFYQLQPHEQVSRPYDQDGLRTVHAHAFMGDPAFVSAYRRGLAASGIDFRWHWRVHVGLWAARVALDVAGDFVEFGVGHGFMSSAIFHHLDWNWTGRRAWLVDTFDGLQSEEGAPARERQYNRSYEKAVANFAEWPEVRVLKGAVPEALSNLPDHPIAFAHVDMNDPAPETAAVRWLWPRLTGGGVVLFDDYAYDGYETQRRAMDALAAELGFAILSLPTGQGLAIKPRA